MKNNNLNSACKMVAEDWINNIPIIENISYSNEYKRQIEQIKNSLKEKKTNKIIRFHIKIAVVAAIVLMLTISAIALSNVKSYIITWFNDNIRLMTSYTETPYRLSPLENYYVPENFEKIDEQSSAISHTVKYAYNEQSFILQKTALTTIINDDIEHSGYSEFIVNDIKVYELNNKDSDTITMQWNDSNFSYILIGNIDRDEFIKIILSLY